MNTANDNGVLINSLKSEHKHLGLLGIHWCVKTGMFSMIKLSEFFLPVILIFSKSTKTIKREREKKKEKCMDDGPLQLVDCI